MDTDTDLQKYKELYDLSKEVFSEELDRSARIDDKASKYLTALTFFLVAFTFFAKRVYDSILPPEGCLECSLVVFTTSLFYVIIAAWIVLFRAFQIHNLAKIPIDVEFFDENKLVDIYHSLSIGLRENLLINRGTIDRKARYLDIGYGLIYIVVGFMVAVFTLFTLHALIESR